MSEIYQLPDNNGNNGMNIPFSIPLGGFGGGFGFPSSTPNLPSIDNLNEILEKANKDE